MTVFLCFYHVYDGCDEFKSVQKVGSSQDSAIEWVEEFSETQAEWRSYAEYEAEK